MKLLFRMKPQGAFYVGNDLFSAQSFPFSHSDTIFQALLSAWEMLWGKKEKDQLIECFHHPDTIPFIITSCFPAIGDVYFLPKPLAMKEKEAKKKNNAFSWISGNIYKEWLKGNRLDFSLEYCLSPGVYFHPSEKNTIESLCPSQKIWSCDKGRMRNKTSIFGGVAKAYPAEQIYYSQNTDFYLVAEIQEAYSNKFQSILRLLAEEGIGGKRSIGCGSYLYQDTMPIPESLDFLEKPVSASWVLLSLYFPQPKNIEDGLFHKAHWQIMERQGWSKNNRGNSIHNKAIHLIQEGSCFFSVPEKAKALVEVKSSSSSQNACYHYVYPFKAVAPGANL
ncbi:MAG: type III-A CRISPR-associated RAMP protein Csm4 [Candidatus Brocadiae bacterium]|nr:type III-A CRISPR-associated RAMP protein Csm4 [Candidatus Brocadiia bacterium]